MIVRETKRLLLRELLASDAAFMLELLNSEGWIRYIGDRNVHTVDEAEKYLLNGAIKSYAVNGFGLWMIEDRLKSAPVGICGLIRREGLDDVDLGFALLPEYTGSGLAGEAAAASIQIAREMEPTRLVAITTTDNHSSIRLLEKLGFVFDRIMSLPNETTILNLFVLEL